MSNNDKKSDLKKELIGILLAEHHARRNSMYTILESLKKKIEDGSADDGDEIEASISIEHFNTVMESSIKNDGNIVKLIELLLKHNYDGDGEGLKAVKEYQTKLSENNLNITFGEDD